MHKENENEKGHIMALIVVYPYVYLDKNKVQCLFLEIPKSTQKVMPILANQNFT